jgi:polyhydroxybutyrate depolymerase
MKQFRLFFFLMLLINPFRFTADGQTTGSFLFGGLTRTYTVYAPSSWSPGEQLPLLLSLHGLSQTGNVMMG